MKRLNLNWKSILPQIGIVTLFLAISFFYSSPVLEGKTLLGHDSESWAYSAKEARDFNKTHDEPTLWTNSMFGGMPTYQITMPKSNNAIGYIQDLFQQLPSSVFFVFLYLLCFYIGLLCFGVNPWLAVAGSFAFTFASYNFIIIAAGHATKVVSIAYMAPLIGSIYVAFRRNKYTGAALTTIFLSLAIRCNHFQILYYTLFILLFLSLSELIYSIREKTVKPFFQSFGLLCAAAVLAIGMNATMLFTTYEYSKYTMRGESNGLTITEAGKRHGLEKDYITQWSYGIGETATLLIPNAMGGSSIGTLPADSETARKLQSLGVRDIDKTMAQFKLPLYWGTQPFTSGPVYFGAVVLFLFIIGIVLVKGNLKGWLVGAATLMLLLSWGRNFMPLTDFFIDYVPMYNKFRAVSMTLVATGFCCTLLGILGLKAFFDKETDAKLKTKALYVAGGIAGGLSLLLALIPSLAGDFTTPTDAQQFQGEYAFLLETLPIDRANLLRADAWRSFTFIALAFCTLFLYNKKTLKLKWAYAAFAILFIADMYPVCRRYFNDENFKRINTERIKNPSEADKSILNDKSYFRVLDASVDIFNDASPAYFHKNIGGYHAAKLRRYQELIDVYLAKEIQQAMQNAQTTLDIENNLQKSSILNLLNMKYLIYNKDAQPITNPYANGAVWFVQNYKLVDNADEEMLGLGNENLAKTALIDKTFEEKIGNVEADSNAYITLIKYEPNRLQYKSSATSNQVAVFSEIYYDKGWNVYLDGKKSDYFRADYLLRAMNIPAGNHEIEFRFEPKSFSIGNKIATASSALFILALAAYGFLALRKRKTS